MPDRNTKLIARNVAARRSGGGSETAPIRAAGNSAATLLESGVGNCFPGLECDLRNLERRFFPHLEFNIVGNVLQVSAVDEESVAAASASGQLSAPDAAKYRAIAQSIRRRWRVTRIAGDFGPLGQLDFELGALNDLSIGPGRLPADGWTAVRLLKEGSEVRLTLTSPAGSHALAGRRTAYLDPNGALSRIFEVGELTQSLCSPWTHDFRDCLCYYWASNHPDIALPPRPLGAAEGETKWALDTHWERANRSQSDPPVETAEGADIEATAEMVYHEINREWQKLNFVVERRERILPYSEREHAARPLADVAQLLEHLRWAAGVELAIMQEYLVAMSSLRPADRAPADLVDDLRASAAELLRIAIGEMRHLRGVNAVLRALSPAGQFRPALAVADSIPSGSDSFRPVQFRALTQDVILDFIAIEAPSQSVDSVYGRIEASFNPLQLPDRQHQAIRTIMAEGEEHWQTFLFIRQWLGRHPEALYLRSDSLMPAPAGNAAQANLQDRYVTLLEALHDAYERGLPDGAIVLNEARNSMMGATGIQGALKDVAQQGFLPTFGAIGDLRFAPISPPPS